ncbi:hypothetical protein RclHR1_01650029 [Rhizophagus clarus]|nr:hypothetical protein RclHR1_01650029 [Rhizophagus clarus]GES75073.1 hypothetical protein GLOIN_2v1782174 [Rhizophagus clarus]
MGKSQFTWAYPIIEKFAKCLVKYHIYLNAQNIEISKNHQLEIPVRSMEDSISIKIYDATNFFPNFRAKYDYNNLNDKLFTLPYWKTLNIESFMPLKPSKKYEFIQNLPDNIYCKFGIFHYSSSNNAFHACFLWHVDKNLDKEEITKLTGDSSAASNMNEKQVMLHTKQLLVTDPGESNGSQFFNNICAIL